jgi:hypothetical protein
MRIIAFIEDNKVIKKILKHVGLWKIKQIPAPKTTGLPKPTECSMDYSVSQFPLSDPPACFLEPRSYDSQH